LSPPEKKEKYFSNTIVKNYNWKGKDREVKQQQAEKGELYAVMATVVDLDFSWTFHGLFIIAT
jgi:hypothetical protein